MAKITKISTQRRKERYNIFLDGQYAFPVSEAVLIKYRLAKGQEIDQATIAQLQAAEYQTKAYNRALDYLSYQLRSVQELSDHLRDLDFDQEVIAQVVDQLKSLNYLDDQEYANSFVRSAIKISLDGPQKIKIKLKRKKVPAPQIELALELFTPQLMLTNAVKLAQKVQKQAQRQPQKAQQSKMRLRLQTAGYPAEIISQALEQVRPVVNPQEEYELLQATGQKLWRRYQHQINGRQKLYAALARRGFKVDDIHNFTQELN
ncbi:recombination regulator RecX [Bombilactobacillus bombi]|uniref:recombination regulator RecX n=1 Tax=Bombilactobacillus bombi TaxID=1303590 RepID=UPI0015E5D3D8|nr:recombination regulator RecX [Bombilactobacillus bombi]